MVGKGFFDSQYLSPFIRRAIYFNEDRTIFLIAHLGAFAVFPDHRAHQKWTDVNFFFVHLNVFSSSAVICFSIASAAVRSAAVTLIYAFSLGSVPDGRMTTDPVTPSPS